jgi:hypothetical protein
MLFIGRGCRFIERRPAPTALNRRNDLDPVWSVGRRHDCVPRTWRLGPVSSGRGPAGTFSDRHNCYQHSDEPGCQPPRFSGAIISCGTRTGWGRSSDRRRNWSQSSTIAAARRCGAYCGCSMRRIRCIDSVGKFRFIRPVGRQNERAQAKAEEHCILWSLQFD